jgi:hypothetical protein
LIWLLGHRQKIGMDRVGRQTKRTNGPR